MASDGTTCKHPRYLGGGELSLGLPRVRLLQIGDLHLPTAARTERTVDQKDRTFSVELRNVISRQPIKTVFKRIYRMRSEEHTSELQSLMRTSYAVFCLKKQIRTHVETTTS